MHILTQTTTPQLLRHSCPVLNATTPQLSRRSFPVSNHQDGRQSPKLQVHVSDGQYSSVACVTSMDGKSDSGVDVDVTFQNSEHTNPTHDCKIECCKRIIINVSGLKFETQMRTMNRLPQSILGDPAKRQPYWDRVREEYFFDRHRPSFQAILYFYQSGGWIECPTEVPVDVFVEELKFFQVGENYIKDYERSYGIGIQDEEQYFEDTFRRKIWRLCEQPGSSCFGKFLALISVCFILVSVAVFCIETLPAFKGSNCVNVSMPVSANSFEYVSKINFGHPLFVLETTCFVLFSIELVVRFFVCPSKSRFLKNVLNWLDLLTILPFVYFMTSYFVTMTCTSDNDKGVFVSVLRILRVSRIFKLGKHSEGLRVFAQTMKASISELMMFILFLGICIIIFSATIYHAELSQKNSQFRSIPDAFWWSVVSMTTVGYGDVYPVGVFGKIVGSLAVISGILTVALPVPIIVTNFNKFYLIARTKRNMN